MHASEGDVASKPATRAFGKTGATVDAVSLGGEGALRTKNRMRDAVPVVVEALRHGVKYCDTAPAYDHSQDYYGEAFRQVPAARDGVFLASKTHERGKAGALRLLADSLRRLGTDRLDLWQMHDLRTRGDLREIFARGGAIEAAEQAKKEGRVRFIGLTGHHDPAILVEAITTYPFDAVLLPINPADGAHRPFLTTVLPAARERGMGVIGMKVMAQGALLAGGAATADECIRYAMAYADTLIIGCSSPEEVKQNLRIGRSSPPMGDAEQRALEERLAGRASEYSYFKG
jgi:aryl-alcohol dehydrogenase-like predicted oxidoreductase